MTEDEKIAATLAAHLPGIDPGAAVAAAKAIREGHLAGVREDQFRVAAALARGEAATRREGDEPVYAAALEAFASQLMGFAGGAGPARKSMGEIAAMIGDGNEEFQSGTVWRHAVTGAPYSVALTVLFEEDLDLLVIYGDYVEGELVPIWARRARTFRQRFAQVEDAEEAAEATEAPGDAAEEA